MAASLSAILEILSRLSAFGHDPTVFPAISASRQRVVSRTIVLASFDAALPSFPAQLISPGENVPCAATGGGATAKVVVVNVSAMRIPAALAALLLQICLVLMAWAQAQLLPLAY